jgi:Zn-dependent peptidase ImmA (M78 family)
MTKVSSSFQKINSELLKSKLRSMDLRQNVLAENLGIDDGSFSRWISTNKLPSNLIWRVKKEVNFSNEELKDFIFAPRYKVFFRKRFLGVVPEEIQKNAINWAQTFLGLSTLHSDSTFIPTPLDSLDDPEEVADKIRNIFGFDEYLSIRTMVSKLREQGIEVGFIPFKELNICSDDEGDAKEAAFTVTDGKRFCIFLDTDSSTDALSFHLGHELSHVFRSNTTIEKTEERFCNKVAAALIYPKSYFLDHSDAIASALSQGTLNQVCDLIDQFKDDLGGEFEGIVYRLIELGFIANRSKYRGILVSIGKKKSQQKKKVTELYFKNFAPQDSTLFSQFWGNEDISPSSTIYRYFEVIRRGVMRENITPKKLADLFGAELSLCDELSSRWRYEYLMEVNEDGSDSSM